jgi:serine/threonine protein kinase
MILDEGYELADGRYRIESFIAHGGMAEVWRARRQEDGKIHAVKILNENSLQFPELLERFRLEYELTQRLKHPNIIRVHEFGHIEQTGGRLPWFSMDYYKTNMRQRLSQISIGEGLKILLPVLDALHSAHSKNICHRDLKPMNILVDDSGRAVLTDFGIAKETDRNRNLTGRKIIGTAHYVAPEQCMGLEITARSDIYALGVILYHLCTNHFPFEDTSEVRIIRRHINEEPRSVQELNPEISEGLDETLDRCLKKKPLDRFNTCVELASALRACDEIAESEQHILAPGDMICDERFQVLRLIDQGGFAEVYRIRDLKDGGSHALKVCLSALAYDAEMLKRFEREIQIMRVLDHPSIINVTEFGYLRHDDLDLPFFVMPYLSGNLGASLSQPVDPERTMNIVMDVLHALAYAHQFEQGGILHRDLKPSNILISSDGRGFLADFGIAKVSDTVSSLKTRSATMTRATFGTSYYMSPEQIKNEVLDARSDLYSMGILLYEVVTGRRPFDARSSEQIIAMHLYEEPSSPRRINAGVSPKLQAVIMKCLHKDREKRYAEVPELIDALNHAKSHDRWFQGDGPVTGPLTRVTRPFIHMGESVVIFLKSPVTYITLAGLFIGLVMTLVTALGLRTFLGRTPPDELAFFSADSLSWGGSVQPALEMKKIKQVLIDVAGEGLPSLAAWQDPVTVEFLNEEDQQRYGELVAYREQQKNIDPNNAMLAERRMQELVEKGMPKLGIDRKTERLVQIRSESGDAEILLDVEMQRLVRFEYDWKLLDRDSLEVVDFGRSTGLEIHLKDIPAGYYTFESYAEYRDFKTDPVTFELEFRQTDKPVDIDLVGDAPNQRVELVNFDASQFSRFTWLIRTPEGGQIPPPAGSADQPLELSRLPDGTYMVYAQAYDSDPEVRMPYQSDGIELLVDNTPPGLTVQVVDENGFNRNVLSGHIFVLLPSDADIEVYLEGQDTLSGPDEIQFFRILDEGGLRPVRRMVRIGWDPDSGHRSYAAIDARGNSSIPLELQVRSVSIEFSDAFADWRGKLIELNEKGDVYLRTINLVAMGELRGALDAQGDINREWLAVNADNPGILDQINGVSDRISLGMKHDEEFIRKADILKAIAEIRPNVAEIHQAIAMASRKWADDLNQPDAVPLDFFTDLIPDLFPDFSAGDFEYEEISIDDLEFQLIMKTGVLAGFPTGTELLFDSIQEKSEIEWITAEFKQRHERGTNLGIIVEDPMKPIHLIIRAVLVETEFVELKGRILTLTAPPRIKFDAELLELIDGFAGQVRVSAESPLMYERTRVWLDQPERLPVVRLDGKRNIVWLVKEEIKDSDFADLRTEIRMLGQFMKGDRAWTAAWKTASKGLQLWTESHRETLVSQAHGKWLQTSAGRLQIEKLGQELAGQVDRYARDHADSLLEPPAIDPEQIRNDDEETGFLINRDAFNDQGEELELQVGWISHKGEGGPEGTIDLEFDEEGIYRWIPERVGKQYDLLARWTRIKPFQVHSEWQRHGPLYSRHTQYQATPVPQLTATPTPEPVAALQSPEQDESGAGDAGAGDEGLQPGETPEPGSMEKVDPEQVVLDEAMGLTARITGAISDSGRRKPRTAEEIRTGYRALMSRSAVEKDSEFLQKLKPGGSKSWPTMISKKRLGLIGAGFKRELGGNRFEIEFTAWTGKNRERKSSTYVLTLKREDGKIVILNDRRKPSGKGQN